MSAFKFRYMVYRLGANKLFAVVSDPGGVSRKVRVSWFQKQTDPGDFPTPPAHWMNSVFKELEYQQSLRHAGSIEAQYAQAQRRSK